MVQRVVTSSSWTLSLATILMKSDDMLTLSVTLWVDSTHQAIVSQNIVELVLISKQKELMLYD